MGDCFLTFDRKCVMGGPYLIDGQVYGADLKSHYQAQDLKLSKHFKTD